jgi:hypothetical protein
MARTNEWRRKRLIRVCEQFAGARWQTAVSEVSGVPQSTLSMIVRDERKVTALVERAVFEGIVAHSSVIMSKAAKAADSAALALRAVEED